MSLPSVTLLLALAAAQAQAQAPPPAPPPPAQAEAPPAKEASKDVPIPEKIPSPVSEETAPTVTIRSSENGDVVEEYRQDGQIFMVKVTPVRGRPYYLYDDDRNGRLDRSDAERNDISPVYWTIYEWD